VIGSIFGILVIHHDHHDRRHSLLLLAADLWIHIHREQLAKFDELGVRVRLMSLDIEQKPPLTEDMFRIDDSRGFLIIG
jgi:hypothetical protein